MISARGHISNMFSYCYLHGLQKCYTSIMQRTLTDTNSRQVLKRSDSHVIKYSPPRDHGRFILFARDYICRKILVYSISQLTYIYMLILVCTRLKSNQAFISASSMTLCDSLPYFQATNSDHIHSSAMDPRLRTNACYRD